MHTSACICTRIHVCLMLVRECFLVCVQVRLVCVCVSVSVRVQMLVLVFVLLNVYVRKCGGV